MINYVVKPVDETQTFNQSIHAHRLEFTALERCHNAAASR